MANHLAGNKLFISFDVIECGRFAIIFPITFHSDMNFTVIKSKHKLKRKVNILLALIIVYLWNAQTSIKSVVVLLGLRLPRRTQLLLHSVLFFIISVSPVYSYSKALTGYLGDWPLMFRCPIEYMSISMTKRAKNTPMVYNLTMNQ